MKRSKAALRTAPPLSSSGPALTLSGVSPCHVTQQGWVVRCDDRLLSSLECGSSSQGVARGRRGS